MANILFVTSSPRGAASHSTKVAHELVERLTSLHPDATVTKHDLASQAPAALTESIIAATFTPAEARSEEQHALAGASDAYVAELLAADIVVIASGMINFSVPATLKAWIDSIVRAGVTFRYGESGPEGLVRGKKLYLVLASGGVYSAGPMLAFDHQGPYLHSVFSFLGFSDIETIHVEGVAYGPDAVEAAVKAAQEKIAAIAA